MFHTTTEMLPGIGYIVTLWNDEESLGRYWQNKTEGFTVEIKGSAKTRQVAQLHEAVDLLKRCQEAKKRIDDSARAALLELN